LFINITKNIEWNIHLEYAVDQLIRAEEFSNIFPFCQGQPLAILRVFMSKYSNNIGAIQLPYIELLLPAKQFNENKY